MHQMAFHQSPLNEFYDKKAAAQELETQIQARLAEPQDYSGHGIPQLGNLQLNKVAIFSNGEPQKWSLVFDTANDKPVQELVLSVQGILRWRDLPPVTGTRDRLQGRLLALRQQVDIVGLGSSAFVKSLDKIQDIHELFSRTVPNDKLLPWSPESYADGVAISAANRYFTLTRFAGDEASVPLDEICDPTGMLRALTLDGLSHTEDNEVKYFTCATSPTGSKTYESSVPSAFKVGDIVEIQMSLIGVPIKDGSVKMIPKLRALTMLSSQHTRAANFCRVTANTAAVRPPKRLRRQTGYEIDTTPDAHRSVRQKTGGDADVQMTGAV
ncbi:hypothetical protein Hypma_009685 [Hypsizygus marmoreus]|uniref:Uncharacterized protein n=1 Tax=Hypsizygus marmoreus TaxID=39966 RepID=A0A369JV66_HYPMA|nr:hypothetical protein Hypma_009685 [Hypsizygus marmoreus]